MLPDVCLLPVDCLLLEVHQLAFLWLFIKESPLLLERPVVKSFRSSCTEYWLYRGCVCGPALSPMGDLLLVYT